MECGCEVFVVHGFTVSCVHCGVCVCGKVYPCPFLTLFYLTPCPRSVSSIAMPKSNGNKRYSRNSRFLMET